jgi:hypothetical protein
VSTQPPVRYENYPPDHNEAPDDASSGGDPQAPIVRPYVPAQVPEPAPGGLRSRRTAIGLALAVPVTLIGITLVNRSQGNSAMFPGSTYGEDNPDGDRPDWQAPEGTIEVGGHVAGVPAGWEASSDGDVAQVDNGPNRLNAESFESVAYVMAVDEIAHRVSAYGRAFTGKLGEPVDRSTAELQHATLDGVGKYRGLAARLMAELWLDDSGNGLLVVRIMTAKPNAPISVEAQGMVDDLSSDL